MEWRTQWQLSSSWSTARLRVCGPSFTIVSSNPIFLLHIDLVFNIDVISTYLAEIYGFWQVFVAAMQLLL
jgi:hypothetical protein